MKKLFILIACLVTFSCCKKVVIQEQQFVEAIVYVEKINWANYNEPDLLHIYVVLSRNKKGYWYCSRGNGIIDFKTTKWFYSVNYPVSAKYFESHAGKVGVNPYDIPGYFTTD